jgi:serine phosphatase RsbU (regulator of sigma subunit)
MTVEAEIARAARVQRSLLPKQPLLLEGYEVAGGCAHVQAVGGDFYDWYPVEEGEAFTLADVMGKGMAAAIIAATVRAVLRAGSRSHDIVKAVEVAATTLESDLHNAGSFVTLFHARLDAPTGLVRFVDAGHNLSMVYRQDGTKQRLTSVNLPLGAGISTTWEEHRVTLAPGDALVSISDGVLDLFDGTLGGLHRVENIVRYSERAQDAVDELVAMADHSASDDATILIIRRNPE